LQIFKNQWRHRSSPFSVRDKIEVTGYLLLILFTLVHNWHSSPRLI
jgi:hypothetical protein